MTQNKKNTCGDKIKLYRKQQGITQKQLAEKAGIATISIQQYEANSRNPKIETLQKIATALSVPLDAIRSDYDLEYDDIRTLFDEALTYAKKDMIFQQILDAELNSDDIQLLIARNAKKLTIEEKQKIIKILLSDD